MGTWVEIGNVGQTNGTTPVVVVEAPAEGTRRLVKGMTFNNPNSGPVTVEIRIVDGATAFSIPVELQGGDTLSFDDELFVLNTVSKSVQVVLLSEPTLQVTWSATYGDAT